mgnify:CR=1 FL=1
MRSLSRRRTSARDVEAAGREICQELAAQGVSLVAKPVLPSEILKRVRELLTS